MIDKSKILVDADIDAIMDDWFVRDGDTFTHKRTTGRIGWESTLESGDSYSAYLVEAPTNEELIKRAYPLARDMVAVMNPPFPFKIKISPGYDSYTDGKLVCVSTKVFDDPELSPGEKLDTFLGYAVHEGAHLLYTDMELLKEVAHPAIHTIFNILEDERIEMLVGDNIPGFANFLEKTKYYLFDQFYLDYVAPKEKDAKITLFDRLTNLLLYIIRYPKYIKESEVIEFGHYLLEIKKEVLPYPTSSRETMEVAKRVFEIIKEFYIEVEKERMMREASESGESDEKSESSDMGETSDSSGGSSEGKTEMSDEEVKKLLEEIEKSFDKEAKEFSAIMEKTFGDPKSEVDWKDASSDVTKDGMLLGEVCEGVVELGSGKDTFFTKATDYVERYKESVGRVKRFVPAIAKILKSHCKDYKLIHRGMRSGVLDANKLAEAFQGVPTVYVREGEVRTDKVSVCVLLDESGSMSGTRIVAARDAAILINEAVGKIPGVDLFIYGHTGDIKRDYATEMIVYREKGYSPKYSLGSVTAKCQNRDGVAIMEVAKRVRKQTKNPVLFFILSDGEPCAGRYSGVTAMQHVKECVEKVEKMDFSVIQVCINATYDPGKMFKNFVILENMDTLAFELGKAIKRSTMNKAKTHIL